MSWSFGIDYTGRKFGHLTVTSFFITEEPRGSWLCKCDCGNDNIVVYTSDLTNGLIGSCGCDFKNYSSDYPCTYRCEKVSKYTFMYNDAARKLTIKDREFLLEKCKNYYYK